MSVAIRYATLDQSTTTAMASATTIVVATGIIYIGLAVTLLNCIVLKVSDVLHSCRNWLSSPTRIASR